MTARKHLKQLVRARMQKTGESYATARRHLVRVEPPAPLDASARRHFPGSVPAATALRVLLTAAGLKDPHTGAPYSEAMLSGIAGGIGIGVFAFRYEREDISTFFLGARHRWWDDAAYLDAALLRFGAVPRVYETAGAAGAARHLHAALGEEGTCVAWVDAATLPHRAMPQAMSGGGYHVITVYRVDPDTGLAWIGDLTDEPIPISLPELAAARGRIKKQKHRLLTIEGRPQPPQPMALVRDGIRSCLQELDNPSLKPARNNVRLASLRTWAERLHGKQDAESWSRAFRRGAPLWNGLLSIHTYIDHYGTGGGLCRTLFAEFLREAARVHAPLGSLAEQYVELGRAWTALAEAALPPDVPAFREARELIDRRSELTAAGEPPAQIRAVWSRLAELEAAARDAFPLSESDCEALRANLKERVLALHGGEEAALEALRRTVS